MTKSHFENCDLLEELFIIFCIFLSITLCMQNLTHSQTKIPKMANVNGRRNSQNKRRQAFLDVVFSWSLSDILNKHLYKFQVEELPLTFSSTTQYMNSFIYPLFEETRADLLSQLAGISQAPASSYTNMHRIPTGNLKKLLYRMTLSGTNYSPKVGDLIALTQFKPKCIDDLARPNIPFIMAFVITVVNESPPVVQVLLSEMIVEKSLERKKRQVDFVVYLTNLTTYMRIWQALNPAGNMNIIQRTLSFSPSIARNCDQCFIKEGKDVIDLKLRQTLDSFKLDTSQEAAVLSFLEDSKCLHHNSCTQLIWGPPGTGKTKTVASLLFLLLRMKRRTLTCAPTNIAVVGVVTRLLSLVRDNNLGCDTYGLGDILLFGNKERMKISDACDEVLLDVFLDNRIESLLDCLSLWRNYVNYMIQFLENPMQEYLSSTVTKLNNTKTKRKKSKNKKNKNEQKPDETLEDIQCTFEAFAMNKFNILGKKLISCIKNVYTHLPTSVVSLNLAEKMYKVTDVIKKIGECVKEMVNRNESLKEVFDQRVGSSINSSKFSKLQVLKTECLQVLKELRAVSCIPKSMNEYKLKSFCVKNASLIFCTASSSIKLCKNGMKPIEFVLIDEAAQLKECESIIPLQLPGASKAVLIGDERQLQSMVQSKICEKAKFGRSLFERLVLHGHKKHLLNVQYRMHPSISMFPKTEFYDGQIMDGPNVINRARERPFFEGGMYGSYSFINVDLSKEEHDKNYSTRNMVEVAVIIEIIENLYKDSVTKKQTMTVGCISPYKAQVDAILAKLGNKYNIQTNGSTFTVNVRSVDGFQGSEEDVIIFSTVRCNHRGSVGFLTSRERANVALTRARHCMWIVGNKETMIKSGTVWNTLVSDAENRGCVYNARDKKNLAQVMLNAMVELANFRSLFETDSILFKEAIWKVNFTNKFIKRIVGIANLNVRKLVVSLLVKLSNGWRQPKKSKGNMYNDAQGMSNMLETYNVDGHFYLVWRVDIIYENSSCVQVLKFLDILTLSQIQPQAKRLESDFGNYTFDKINRCQTKRIERNLVLPMAWPVDSCHDSTSALTSQLAKLRIDTKLHFDAIWKQVNMDI